MNGGCGCDSLSHDEINLGDWILVVSDDHIFVDEYDQYLILALPVDGAGCMAALDAEHYLQEVGAQEGKSD
jgi:hypothetical protein